MCTNKLNYRLVLVAAAVLAFAACKKECKEGQELQGNKCIDTTGVGPWVDPNQARIEQLERDSAIQANAVRAAYGPALTDPYDIQNWYWGAFNADGNPNSRKTLEDSSRRNLVVVDDMRESYGDPLPANDESLSKLYDASKTYVLTVEELRNLR